MSFIPKTIWYLQSHFRESVRLEEVAAVSGVSKFHLSRAFGYATGMSISRYLRSRRLSEGAKQLAAGGCDVMSVTLDVGYQSHEAFSRAFKEEFGLSPVQVKGQNCIDQLELTEALMMNELPSAVTPYPKVEKRVAWLLAGISRHYAEVGNAGIPGQWQEFGPQIGTVPNQLGQEAFGVVFNLDSDDNHDYLCGVEVSSFDNLPDKLDRLRMPEQTYVVFQHEGHVSELKQTCRFGFAEWIPQSEFELVDAPFFERYGSNFDSVTGYGGLEVWIPVAMAQ